MVMTTMPRRRKKKVAVRIRPCQNAITGWWPAARMASKWCRPEVRHRRVWPSAAIAG